MKATSFFTSALALASYAIGGVRAQSASLVTEPVTGFTFYTTTTTETTGDLTWGYALPPGSDTKAATEYIGYVVGAINNPGPSWSGISHGGPMTNGLLLMFWPNNGEILTSFRWATGYVAPDIYTGDATITPIYTNINATHYTYVYRCQNCWSWSQGGVSGSQPSTQGYFLLGWCQAYSGLDNPASVNTTISQQHDAQDLIDFPAPTSAIQASYSAWATKTIGTGGTTTTTSKPITTTTSTSTTSTVQTTTTSSAATHSGTPAPSTTYDYIVVGGGAGGITIADKLSEAGHSVLMIERGPASSYRWGGRIQPAWLSSSNLTRFDVPGLDNEIWENSAGIACADNDQMTGCVLGGGTAVNAGLWWHVPDIDWDYNFPTGWHSTDVAAAASRVFSRIPGTYAPSLDGVVYLPQGYNLVGGALAKAGWQNVTANSSPNSKNQTFSHPPFMYSHGERGGPLATYLVTANARKNFKMILNTAVKRVIRQNGHITGVETYAYQDGGYQGIFNVTATTGRVILSSGTFGTSRILFRSGIGPSDMLAVIQNSTDGPSMIDSKQWINLPVGYNLDDHLNTDTVISHPSIQFYDFYAAYNSPIASDASAYLNSRTHILAQSAPNIAPVFWDQIKCSDGITRQLQWTARCEGSRGAPNNYSMTISQYLGRGSTSRGRATIDLNFNMHVSQLPYLQTAGDLEAVTQGIINLQKALTPVANLTWLSPAPGQSASDYLAAYPIVTSQRTANHWLGTAKMGTDDGRQNSGTAVVDTNTKVYGTDNLFVVDASIFPGMMSTNPSAMIVTAAEHASEKLLALANTQTVAKWGQCGGNTYSGSSVCAAGTTCTYSNAYYWQCL